MGNPTRGMLRKEFTLPVISGGVSSSIFVFIRKSVDLNCSFWSIIRIVIIVFNMWAYQPIAMVSLIMGRQAIGRPVPGFLEMGRVKET